MTEPAGPHQMTAPDAIDLLDDLAAAGVDVCVGGGWAVDALVGRQTRAHSDLDLWVPAADLDPLIRAAVGRGLDRVLPWGGDRPWNFVLHDGHRLKIDLHLYERLPDDRIHYGSVLTGIAFRGDALAGSGHIGERAVHCESPDWGLECHLGYPPRPVDRHDVAALCARFDWPPPPGFSTA